MIGRGSARGTRCGQGSQLAATSSDTFCRENGKQGIYLDRGYLTPQNDPTPDVVSSQIAAFRRRYGHSYFSEDKSDRS